MRNLLLVDQILITLIEIEIFKLAHLTLPEPLKAHAVPQFLILTDVTIPSSNRSSTATTPNASMATLSWAMTSEGKKKRQPYKKDQISRLEYEYKINPYLTNKRRAELSLQLMLDEKQVKVWFQNRRMKDKKLRQRVSGPFPHGELMIPCNERLIN
ncbi:hypothetical protein B9Z55_011717 [Caenorhabditis nigoni]|uniref:Homeobox domain-containing protein n=1 Tax=Caenorhabditis nigoni TaxID=1611254 RepID=A0A2G5ULB5_9PELO|nr:hypothetical protein B9Z55_011717 [Caenorhabditis nigoni]